MLSNAYFLAKIHFDTAENEPAKNLQKLAKFFKILQNLRSYVVDHLAPVLSDSLAPDLARVALRFFARRRREERRLLRGPYFDYTCAYLLPTLVLLHVLMPRSQR